MMLIALLTAAQLRTERARIQAQELTMAFQVISDQGLAQSDGGHERIDSLPWAPGVWPGFLLLSVLYAIVNIYQRRVSGES